MNWAIRGDKEPDNNKQFEWVSVKEYKKLSKYKRAFEILKSKEIFEFKDDNRLYLNAEDHNWWGDIIESSFVRLSDEEYELLEELMNNE